MEIKPPSPEEATKIKAELARVQDPNEYAETAAPRVPRKVRIRDILKDKNNVEPESRGL